MNKKDFKTNIFSLADRLYPMLFRFLKNQNDVKDALQDIMLKLWNKRDQLSDHPNVKGFVFLTARNHCLDILKKSKISTVDLDEKISINSSKKIDSDITYNDLKNQIERILDRFPIQQKQVLMLRDIDGLEYKEIAEITGLKVEHIRVILSRTRKQVQMELKKHHSYE